MKRADCMPGGSLYARPCPYATCRHHLANMGPRTRRSSRLKRDESQSCALDVADDGRQRLETIGKLLGMTRERVRQIEVQAIAHARSAARKLKLDLGDFSAPVQSAAAAQAREQDGERDSRNRDPSKLREYRERWRAKKAAGGAR